MKLKLKPRDVYTEINEILQGSIKAGLYKYYKYNDTCPPTDQEFYRMTDSILNYCMIDLADLIDFEDSTDEMANE